MDALSGQEIKGVPGRITRCFAARGLCGGRVARRGAQRGPGVEAKGGAGEEGGDLGSPRVRVCDLDGVRVAREGHAAPPLLTVLTPLTPVRT